MRRLVVTPEAEADLTKAAVWYAGREHGLGLELLADVQQSITRALQHPEAFLRIRKNPEVRRILAKRFPYRIFFLLTPDAFVVFAVLHAARNERVWRERLRHA